MGNADETCLARINAVTLPAAPAALCVTPGTVKTVSYWLQRLAENLDTDAAVLLARCQGFIELVDGAASKKDRRISGPSQGRQDLVAKRNRLLIEFRELNRGRFPGDAAFARVLIKKLEKYKINNFRHDKKASASPDTERELLCFICENFKRLSERTVRNILSQSSTTP